METSQENLQAEASLSLENAQMADTEVKESTNKINLKKETPEPKNNPEKEESKENDADNSEFECNICFDSPNQPVVTPCGHLYCWPCIYRVSRFIWTYILVLT